MNETSAMWMFFSIAAICYTWHKIAIATAPSRKAPPAPARDMEFVYNGQPVNGSLELIVDGKTSRFKLVDGKIQ